MQYNWKSNFRNEWTDKLLMRSMQIWISKTGVFIKQQFIIAFATWICLIEALVQILSQTNFIWQMWISYIIHICTCSGLIFAVCLLYSIDLVYIFKTNGRKACYALLNIPSMLNIAVLRCLYYRLSKQPPIATIQNNLETTLQLAKNHLECLSNQHHCNTLESLC